MKHEEIQKRTVKVVSVSTCSGFSTRYGRNEPQQKAFDKGVMDMMSVDGHPFNFVHSIGFQNLVMSMDPKLRIKSRQAYTKKMKTMVATEVVTKVRETLSLLVPRVCHYSCDIWSTRRWEGVLGVVAHFISDDWQLQSICIGIKQMMERHTSENIKEAMKEILNKYGVGYEQVRMSLCNTEAREF